MADYKQQYINSLETVVELNHALAEEERKNLALEADRQRLIAEKEALQRALELATVKAANATTTTAGVAVAADLQKPDLATAKNLVNGKQPGARTSAGKKSGSKKKSDDEENGDVVWTVILRRMYPGQLSHLHKYQRHLINESVLEYLTDRVSEPRLVHNEYVIPADLTEDFIDWMGTRMDELIDSDWKGGGVRGRSHSFSEGAGGAAATAAAANAAKGKGGNKQQQQVHRNGHVNGVNSTTATTTTNKKSKHGDRDTNSPETEPNAKRQRLDTENNNNDSWVAWPDVVRQRHPTFIKAMPEMSTFTRVFLENRNMPLTRVNRDVRNAKPTFGIPRRLHGEFLDAFDEQFVDEDGSYGKRFRGVFSDARSPRMAPKGGVAIKNEHAPTQKKPSSIMKPGVKRYSIILGQMMPGYSNLEKEVLIAIKRGVRDFLKEKMGDRFDDCLIRSSDPSVPRSYGVPDHLRVAFQRWAFDELKRCFPDKEILKPYPET